MKSDVIQIDTKINYVKKSVAKGLIENISCISTKCHIKIGIVLFNNINKYIDTYVINNCIISLHSGLTIKELCMVRDDDKLLNLDNTDCSTLIDLLYVL